MCGNKKPGDVPEELHGPVKNRSCTDFFCVLILVAFVGGMVFVGYVGFQFGGDPYRLVYGMDSWGNTCNRKNEPIHGANYSGVDARGLTKQFFFNFWAELVPEINSSVKCISSCPTPDATIVTEAALRQYASSSNLKLCRYDLRTDEYFNDESAQVCPALTSTDPSKYALGLEEHSTILNRCIPKRAQAAAASVIGSVAGHLSALAQCDGGSDLISMLMSDMQRTWQEILYVAGIAVVVSIAMTILMRFFAAIITYALVIGCAVGSMAGTGFCWYQYFTLKDSSDENEKEQAQNWLIYSSAVSVVCLIILLILLVMFKRIALVVQLFREASKCVAKMPAILLQPLWSLVALLVFVAATGIIYTYVETSGEPQIDSHSHRVELKQLEVITYMKWYYLFGVLWLIQLVFACHQTVVAGAVATWYFADNKSKLGWPIVGAVWRVFRYHLGSAAFGAFLVALVQFARIVLAYISKKLRGRAGKLVDFILKCLACCLWCFEKVLKFLNKNAYIMVAIYGYNFCRGARRAFTLLVSNALRVAALNSVGTFVLLLGKIGVAAVCVFIGLELLKTKTQLCFIWVPLTVVAIVSLLIAHVFLSVYGLIIDTIFLCFCEDCERNDGITRPYFMSKDLMQYVSNASRALSATRKREAAAAEAIKMDTVPSAPKSGPSQAAGGVQW